MKNIIDKIRNTLKYHTLLHWLCVGVGFLFLYLERTKLDLGGGYDILIEFVVVLLWLFCGENTNRLAVICLMIATVIMSILSMLIILLH